MRWFDRKDYLRRRGHHLEIGRRRVLTSEGRVVVGVLALGVGYVAAQLVVAIVY